MAKLRSPSSEQPQGKKRDQISQADIPAFPLSEAVRVAKALLDNYAGGPEAPHNVAIACELSPTSSYWRMLAGAALAYGLTSGSFSADSIKLTDLAKRLLSPTIEGDDLTAHRESVLKPKILRDFYQKYDRNKFPADKIAENVLADMGIPREKVSSYLSIVKKNGEDVGFITQTRTGPFVALTGGGGARLITTDRTNSVFDDDNEANENLPSKLDNNFDFMGNLEAPVTLNPWDQPIKRVFVSHGKNQHILDQVKEIVAFGKFEPVVSKDRETVSKPVPDKVMDDMRSCQAAVIHVAGEKLLADEDGKLHPQINGNVLIEIGAAIALYKRRFILLVEDGLPLPSNLQGLYEVRYSGSALDGVATMKLLKAFNDFSSASS